MGLKVDLEADAETVNCVVRLIEQDLGGKPHLENKNVK